MNGGEIEPVDIITFGSPCTDMSIAGRRAGLEGKQSVLFYEAIRIIKEMRCKTNGKYPRWICWENVPGAFSSNKGEDFRAVLEAIIGVVCEDTEVPMPEKNRWPYADLYMGDGWSLAYRTLDAQYWGVPQRRRRIALVVDFGGQRAGEILFERTGVSGHLEPSIPPWQGIARNTAHGAAGYDRVVGKARVFGISSFDSNAMKSPNPSSGIYEADTSRTLDLNGGNPACNQGGIMVVEPVRPEAYTLKIRSGRDGGGKGPLVQTEKSATLSTLQDQTLFVAAFTAGQGAKAKGIGWVEEQAPTLRTDGGLSAMPTVLCRAHGQANAETLEDSCPTLNCNHEQPIVFESHSQDARYTQQGNTSPACTAQWGTGGNNMPLVAEKSLTPWDEQARRVYSENGLFPALSTREKAGQNQQTVLTKAFFRWIVRRITPMECERLQGYPDGWTDIGEWTDSKGKRHKPADSSRYRSLGNSIALPQWWWITCKMAAYLPEQATLGSLFDGIGGFPLVWETKHGKGTAVWASEIEEFPIAVTKKHFGGVCDET